MSKMDANRCLMFHLAGPMSSWGECSIGNYRPTNLLPTKSSVAGILAAALGLDRTDTEHQSILFRDYDYVIIGTGKESELVDYSTVESSQPDSEERSTLPPRSRELARSSRNTILVDRRYVCNGFYTVLVRPRAGPGFKLEELEAALRRPRYTPYLGRKSCPLAFPMCPSIEDATDFRKLIIERSHHPFKMTASGPWSEPDSPTGFIVHSTCRIDGLGHCSEHVRRDDMPDRRNWQFIDRHEFEYTLVNQ